MIEKNHFKRILITGSGGFIGKNLTRELSRDYLVDGLDLPGLQSKDLNTFYTWDDLKIMPKYEIIIHLAGKAHDLKDVAKIDEYFEVNVGFTKKIMDFFIDQEFGKFIFFSSVKSVADFLDGKLLTEDFIPKPLTAYGKSKLAAERYLLGNNPSPQQNIYILRPCITHGPGNKGNLNLLHKLVAKGIPYPLGAYHNQRSLLSVYNLIWVLRSIIEKPVPSGIYNIADDEPLSTNEIVEMIAESAGKKRKIWRVPISVVNAFGRLGDVLEFPLNTERIKKLTESYIVYNDKIKKALDVDILPLSSREGLRRTFESMSK